jgi:DNA-binding NarL/FixJ family response regulator
VYGRFEPNDLLRAVRAVAAGEGWLTTRAAKVVAATMRGPGAAPPTTAARPTNDLTAREHDVLNLLCLGLSNAAIGEHLALSEKTVKNHLNHAFAKINVTSRSEAIVYWMRTSKT